MTTSVSLTYVLVKVKGQIFKLKFWYQKGVYLMQLVTESGGLSFTLRSLKIRKLSWKFSRHL